MAPVASLSIVLPALNEAGAIAAALQRLHAQAPEAELLVVDGGSTDGTAEVASRAVPGVRVLSAPRGRALQLNAGARAARGDWLLFLHVDTQLPDGFQAGLTRAAQRGRAVGAFRLSIAGRHPLLPLAAGWANLRTRFTHIALGDQALFCTRALFEARGGFPALPILEDYTFTRDLRQDGIPLHMARLAVRTSGRRWDTQGFWRTWWQFRRIYAQARRTPDHAALRASYEDIR